MTTIEYVCERCGVKVVRAVGDEGRKRFCSTKCARAAQRFPSREVRFWAKVRKGDGCWEWTGQRHGMGYGVLGTGPRGAVIHQYAHRVSWELHNGPIPEGKSVCHHCDNPPCVRPDHLFVGSNADNTADRDRKGRQRAPRGQAVKNARFTDADIVTIRARRAAGEKLRVIAADYDVTTTAIHLVATRKSWKHVE